VPMDEVVALQIQEAEQQGNTVIVAAIDGRVALMAGLSDEPNDTAAACVWQLQEQGIQVFMVSGDQPAAAKAIAAKVGIPAANVHSEVLPWNKGDIVKEHQAAGLIVAFVGDGLNDAPALAQADVGVALGAGTEVAIDSADAVLVKNSLQDLITFLDLSGATIRRVYFNFAWAFGYNCIMLPIASGLLFPMGWQMQMPPVVAGGLMVCSSLSVLGSSLALKLYKPPVLKKN
jgi:Cu+-exporting ATPase